MKPAENPPIIRILGTGSYLPEQVLSNADLEKMMDTSDEWIFSRTGIRERRVADISQATSDLALEASLKALEDAQLDPKDLDLILVATITPDTHCPSCACWLQGKLGATRASAFDVAAACSGFIYGLSVAEQYLKTGACRHVLLVAAEIMTRTVNWNERESCILWGDGAGACVLTRGDKGFQVLSTHLHSDGNYADMLQVPGGGSRVPWTEQSLRDGLHYLKMQGKESYKIAVNAFTEVSREALASHGYGVEHLKMLIPHQANARMIQQVAKLLGLSMEKVYMTIERYGNISSATIPIALDEAIRGNNMAPGDLVLLCAFGGGLTWGSALLQR